MPTRRTARCLSLIHICYDISQGAFVYSVEDGSPAAAAGLQLGDVITAIDGTEITSLEDLTAAQKGYAAGDTSTPVSYTHLLCGPADLPAPGSTENSGLLLDRDLHRVDQADFFPGVHTAAE